MKRTQSVLMFTLLTAAAGHAAAQSLEEVVVTAQKRAENIQQTPIAMSAFSPEALERAGAVELTDLGDSTPNVNFQTGNSSNITMAVSIRGVNSNEPSLAQDSKVGLYLDGVYIGKNAGSVFDLADLERVEILKGPQGTLYGKNTTGGAVNVITTKPSGEFGFKEKFTMGNKGRLRSQTSIDTPRVGGVAAKFSYMTRSFDGVAKNTNPRGPSELGRDDSQGYRIALNWQATDILTADYAYDRTFGKGTSRPFQLSYVNPALIDVPVKNIAGATLVPAGAADHPFRQIVESGVVETGNKRRGHLDLDNQGEERYDIRGHNLTISLDMDAFELTSITGYREFDISITPGGSDLDGGAWSYPVFHAATVRNGGNSKHFEQFSQELQIVGDALDDKLEYAAGLYYYSEEGKELNNDWDVLLPVNTRTGRGLVPNLYLPNPAAQGEDYSIDNDSKAIYGQAKYTPEWFDSRLGFTLGLRQTWDTKEAVILDANPHFTAKKSWKNFNPSFTVDFAITDSVNAYAKIATGYNAGSHPVRSSSQAAFNLTADPEKLIDYEVGLKSDWFDNRLRANLAAYYYDYKDLQVSDFQAGSTVVTNAGKAVLRGFEMDLSALPLDQLTVDFSYGYMDFDYKEFMLNVTNPATGVAQLTDVTDTARAPYSPMHSARLALQYEFAPTPVGVFTASVEGTYKDDFHFSPNNFQNVAADSRTLLDARLSLGQIPIPQGDLRIALWGKNLENKEYREAGIDFGAIGIAGNLYGDPRSYGVDVIYTY